MRLLDDHLSLGDVITNPIARLTAALDPAAAKIAVLLGGTVALIAAKYLA